MSDALKTTGNGGIALIKQYEGLRLTTYKDAVGIPTIGYGHVENPIPPGGTRTITAEARSRSFVRTCSVLSMTSTTC